MNWILYTAGFMLFGFVLAIVWDLLDWADINEHCMVAAFIIGWPVIVVIYVIRGLNILLTKLGVRTVHAIKRWLNK